MKRLSRYLATTLTVLSLWASSSSAHAGTVAMPPPGPNRIADADAVIVGKVEALEPQDVKVGNATYRIAVVKINQGLKGTKDAKTLRIGFVPPPMPKEGDKGPFVITSGPRPLQLVAGQEGLFLLKKQAKEDFYVIGGVIGYYINSDRNPSFEKEIQVAKASALVLTKPQEALKSKSAEERLLAAAILIEKYRNYRGPPVVPKQEPIDAEESKLILQVLADADWKTDWNFNSLRPIPGQLFQRLGITAKDGFTPPAGGNFQAAAQAWVRENAQKYHIQCFVAGDTK
jgi:hypothetical protein